MVVALGMVVLRLHDCHSLKGKRKVVRAVIARTANRFNASVAETGAQDNHQRAEIGFALVGNDRRHLNSTADRLFNFVEDTGLAEVIDTQMEILNI